MPGYVDWFKFNNRLMGILGMEPENDPNHAKILKEIIELEHLVDSWVVVEE